MRQKSNGLNRLSEAHLIRLPRSASLTQRQDAHQDAIEAARMHVGQPVQADVLVGSQGVLPQ